MKLLFISTLLILCSTELLPQKVGDAYPLNINNIYLPINNKGVIAEVVIPSPTGNDSAGGKFAGHIFLFSGGFFLSGYSNGELWANAVATSSIEDDYLPGTYSGGETDTNAVLYKLSSSDQPFSQSWQNWTYAVALGADFYDGDGDGVYNPVDLNGNNQWDPDEDRPDLIGDETLWCVYHDAVPENQRYWVESGPQGIEIKQTVFAYSTIPELQNIIFIRYRIKNTGMVADTMTNLYFSVWDDADIGNSSDDKVGCDTILQSGYSYNNGQDNVYGINPPAFLTTTLQGPIVYIPGETFIDINGNGIYDPGIDNAIDTALVRKGQILGIKNYPGAKNQHITSFTEYINGDPTIMDPMNINEARNYMLGLTRTGDAVDPCTWAYGNVYNMDCSQVNPFFWYSGDPTTGAYGLGWICIYPSDQRQLLNIGPFTLDNTNEAEIFVAYSVGQGTDALNSVTKGKMITNIARTLYEHNFDPESVTSVADQTPGNFPNAYELAQNFPNPFNPETQINYKITEAGNISIKVFDILGNEVATLVNKFQNPGEYSVTFDGKNFASGIYFYSLKVNNFYQVRKMILLK